MRVLVVGAGVGGLTAARDLVAGGHEVVVLDAADRAGGKLRGEEVAGVRVDVGAEAMLARRPEGTELAAALGLPVVHPTAATSRIWTRQALRPLPRSLMGVPMDVAALQASGILSAAAMERVLAEPGLPPEDPAALSGDVSVGDLVDRRLGPEVTDRLVEPLLGGVYAGRAREISARAAVPQLLALAARGSLVEQAATLPATPGAPVFAGVAGGMARLPQALGEGLDVRTGVRVTALARRAGGFVVETAGESPSGPAQAWSADAVVVATPAGPAAALVEPIVPRAAAELRGIAYATVAVVSLALRAADVAGLPELDGSRSGLLVPAVDGRRIKAATFSFGKWAWVREAGAAADGEPVVHLRTSIGRAGDAGWEQLDDEELVAQSLSDLHEAVGLEARPVDHHVQRWVDGLPQYAVGHLDRVARIRAAVATVPGLELAGAAYDGVGVPAVIAGAHQAAARIAAAADHRGE